MLERLKSLAAMPVAELRSRHNALPELLAELNRVLPLLSIEPHRESSAELVSVAQKVMHMEPLDKTADPAGFNALLSMAKSLAGSVISQSEPDDPRQTALPLDEAATRSLVDAQKHGQALPLERTVVIGEGSTGPKEPPSA